jgi:hypothetical protein
MLRLPSVSLFVPGPEKCLRKGSFLGRFRSAGRNALRPEVRLPIVPLDRLRNLFVFVVGTSLRAFGFGVRLLDYRKVEDGVYDATRWVTALFLPIFPLSTLRIRPGRAESALLGAVVQTKYNLEVLAERPTPLLRALRMYLFGWLLIPVVMAGPAIAALIYAKTASGGAPSLTKTVLLVVTIVWGVVAAGLLNHRREKLYDWGDNLREAA